MNIYFHNQFTNFFHQQWTAVRMLGFFCFFFSLKDLFLNQVIDKSSQSYSKRFIFQPLQQKAAKLFDWSHYCSWQNCVSPLVKLAENWHDNDTKNPLNFQNKAPQAAFNALCGYYINITSDKLEKDHRETTL